MMKCFHGLRWAVNLKELESHPHFELFYRTSVQSISEEEFTKHKRFMYRDDSLACLISRLLYRQVAITTSECKWSQVKVERTNRGKPFITYPETADQFNISHQGDLVVLATDKSLPIGVDVMRIDKRGDESADSHRLKMHRLFTEKEHALMETQEDERAKWTSFYRIWCLKEAVLKATGTGLAKDLRTLEFIASDKDKHKPGCFLTSTTYNEDGVYDPNWIFEESFIGEDHTIAVGRICPSASLRSDILSSLNCNPTSVLFESITWSRILNGAETICPLEDSGESAYEEYRKKSIKDF